MKPTHSPERSSREQAAIRTDRRWTIPNLICLFRLFGSLTIIPATLAERPRWVLVLFLILAATDWIDGRIARSFDQLSRIGPKLDSLADVTMYGMLLFSILWLRTEEFVSELPLLLLAAVMFAIACAASWWKFGTLPSYHTLSAKATWGLMAIAAVSLFLGWSVWPLRVGLLGVVVTNIENTAITATLSSPQTDVRSIVSARRLQRDNARPQQRDNQCSMESDSSAEESD